MNKINELTGQQNDRWEAVSEAGRTLKTGKMQFCNSGLVRTSVYEAWNNMKNRCLNPRNQSFKDYGARGIAVCNRWEKFSNFYADMGDKPEKMSIERIDNSKGYSPNNCKWATWKEQQRNTRRNRMIKYRGETRCLAAWAEELNITTDALRYRLSRYPPQLAFNM